MESNISCLNHFIDFWVIFGADLAAAFVALKAFESRKEDRDKAKSSLNSLFKICSALRNRYSDKKKNLSDDDENSITPTGISKDIDQNDTAFEALNDDVLFWLFNGSETYKDQYLNIRALKEKLNPRTVGQANKDLAALVRYLDDLMSQILKRLK